MTTDPSDIVERLLEAARRVAKHCMGEQSEALVSVPVSPSDVDAIMIEAAAEIERLRAALEKAMAEERERCARVAEDFEAQVRNNITKTVDMQGDFGAIYASKRIAAAIRARGR